ncbi:hypothetical protein RBU61_07600 [Tissierella sp. MB52-C2]|uniref:hypothetical protein n=1 Tax=Tissierella sp. MB52-C2 TaxID=3070999 RepID=UPI00280A4D7A|nr:hypothetical protein [Tissierella sp. MB52-C2]WMM26528.1 hypothetical protein RBU61_07600 [Tissierella sp. MB52-C2]
MPKRNNINEDNSYNNKNQENDNNHYVGFGVGVGLIGGCLFAAVIGVVFGLMGDSLFPMVLALGSGFGMLMGIVIGAVMDNNKNKV